jgi:chromosome partitioning protein
VGIVIAVINQKGGVGKTTTSVNLGAAFAELNKKVLLIDIDAQSNLTTHLGLSSPDDGALEAAETGTTKENLQQNQVPEYSMYDVLRNSKSIKEIIIKRGKNLDVAPSSLLMSAADLELGGVVGRELILKRALATVRDSYDIIIIDCPPALGLLSLNALAAVDKVIIPVQSEYLALHGVRQLLDTIDQVRGIYNPELVVGGVLICLHDNRKRLARAVSDTIRNYFGDLVFDTVVRSNVSLAEAPASGQTIFEYSSKSPGAEDYQQLANEILNTNGEINE